MADVHRVRLVAVEFGCRFSNLRFLGQDAQAVFRQVFEEPGVDDVEAVIRVAFGPAVPGKSPRLIALRSDEFRDFGFDGEAEGLEAKSRIGGKLRALRVVEFDVGQIAVSIKFSKASLAVTPWMMTSFEAKLSVVPGRYGWGQLISCNIVYLLYCDLRWGLTRSGP